jgi:hypothetical protein
MRNVYAACKRTELSSSSFRIGQDEPQALRPLHNGTRDIRCADERRLPYRVTNVALSHLELLAAALGVPLAALLAPHASDSA